MTQDVPLFGIMAYLCVITKKTNTMTTTNTINTDIKVLDKSIMVKNIIRGKKGTYTAIVKVRGGFLTTVTRDYWENIYDVFSHFEKGALQTIEFRPDGEEYTVVVFAMKGKKCIIMDKELAEMITVGDVNSTWVSTNLYNQEQYKAVKATSWSSRVFVVNE